MRIRQKRPVINVRVKRGHGPVTVDMNYRVDRVTGDASRESATKRGDAPLPRLPLRRVLSSGDQVSVNIRHN